MQAQQQFQTGFKEGNKMVWAPPQNGRQSLAKEDCPVDIVRQEKWKTATIMEEPSDKLHDEKQKHGRIYGRRQTSLMFGSEWTALGCIDPIYYYYYYYYYSYFYLLN